MALQNLQFRHGLSASIVATPEVGDFYVGSNDHVLRLKLSDTSDIKWYGDTSIVYNNNEIYLVDINGNKIGSGANLTLDSFLEGSKYFAQGESQASDVLTWAKTYNTAFTDDDVTQAFADAFSGYSKDTSAIVMVMHTEASSGDTHTLVVIPVGKLVGDAQTEVNAIETAVGLGEDGSYVKTTGANYTNSAETVVGAIDALDKALKAVQNELDATQKGAGLNEDGSFTNAATGVSSGAATIAGAIKAIDDNLGVKSTGTTIAADTVWAAIEEAAAEKSVVVGAESNQNLTVTSADTNGKVTYTVNETGLTPAANGVVIASSGTVAANLGALDTKIGAFTASPDYNDSFSAATEYAVTTADTVALGISKLDNKLAALVDEVIANEETTANAIDAIAEAAGIHDESGVIAYQKHEEDTILSAATTLDSADIALANAIRALEATAGALKGKDAIVVTAESESSDALQVSLTLSADNAASAKTTGVVLAQDADGLKATLNLENTAATTKATPGIGLAVNGTTGNIEAKLYWGTF